MKNINSLRKSSDFNLVYNEGSSKADRFIVLYIRRNSIGCNRLGISISKKVGNSVVRHHLARLVRESYRLHEDMFNSGLDMVVIARKPAGGISYNELTYSILRLADLQKALKHSL